MSSPSHGQGPSPALIFDTFNAYQRTNALRGAIELDLFSAIAEGNTTAAAIAAKIQASEKGTRVLCDFLTIIGFLTKENGQYGLTADSAVFLNRKSPAYLGSIANFIANPSLTANFADIAGIVRKGGTLLEGQGTVEANNPLWVGFARSMAPMMYMPAELMAKLLGAEAAPKWKVLDIAAGHGIFGITIAKLNPNAEIFAQDWEAVLAVATENAQKAGVAARHKTIPGDAFTVDLGSGYDVVLLTNFLHHFDVASNEKLLRKIHAALAPGGRVLTLDFIPNEDRVSPPIHATFSMMMLGSTRAGDAYTFSEYDRMFGNAGFSRSELRELAPTPQRVIVSYK